MWYVKVIVTWRRNRDDPGWAELLDGFCIEVLEYEGVAEGPVLIPLFFKVLICCRVCLISVFRLILAVSCLKLLFSVWWNVLLMLLVFGRLACRGIVLYVSISLGVASLTVLVSPGYWVPAEGGRYFLLVWRDHNDGLFHDLSDGFVLIKCVHGWKMVV